MCQRLATEDLLRTVFTSALSMHEQKISQTNTNDSQLSPDVSESLLIDQPETERVIRFFQNLYKRFTGVLRSVRTPATANVNTTITTTATIRIITAIIVCTRVQSDPFLPQHI